jgi:transcription antitermination factor NusG
MEASGLDLSRCIGKPGAQVEVRKGVLAGFDGEFVQLESNQNVHVISRRHIISLKVFGGGKGG